MTSLIEIFRLAFMKILRNIRKILFFRRVTIIMEGRKFVGHPRVPLTNSGRQKFPLYDVIQQYTINA